MIAAARLPRLGAAAVFAGLLLLASAGCASRSEGDVERIVVVQAPGQPGTAAPGRARIATEPSPTVETLTVLNLAAKVYADFAETTLAILNVVCR